MSIADTRYAVNFDHQHPGSTWRPMIRVDTTGASPEVVVEAIQAHNFEKLVYAEGDSWFDKFTPLPRIDTNLLDAIRTPFVTGVVDVSHIGDEIRDMVRGWQRERTEQMFRLFEFDAILLSAGGNDLKNIISAVFADRARAQPGGFSDAQLDDWARPASFEHHFDTVLRDIDRFVTLRDRAENARTRAATLFVHGYDYIQPRPAGAMLFAGSRIGKGPWLHPALQAAGLDAARMRSVSDAIVDQFNRRLADRYGSNDRVQVIDQRGLLTPASPGSTGEEGDWLDEIHPSAIGFAKLARNRWDVPLGRTLGWNPAPQDLQPTPRPTNPSTALADEPRDPPARLT
ncbi:MAG: hypothetical protein EPO12_19425 [Aquabacterium sp.]|nr:MAG: hypothetical protein EPO12_19425 [Aquabacterium sp.]